MTRAPETHEAALSDERLRERVIKAIMDHVVDDDPHDPETLVDNLIDLIARRTQPSAGEGNLHIIFDGPPSHESGRFVEVENDAGYSIRAGEWVERPDGLWDLVIPRATPPDQSRVERLEANRQRAFADAKDLSKQGWSALSDARLFLNLGTPADLEEAKQNIDLAQASFADTIIAATNRAESAEAALKHIADGQMADYREFARQALHGDRS